MGVHKWVVAGVGGLVAGLMGVAVSGGTETRPAGSTARTTAATAGGAELEHPALEQLGAVSASVTPGSPAHFRVKEERDRVVLRLTDQLDYLGRVFANATPGSPAQFRAREEAESIREHLRTIGRG